MPTVPYLSEKNLEVGTTAEFDSETDTASKLNVEHYTTLSTYAATPYMGAYCVHINQGLGASSDCYLVETADFDTSAAGTIYVAGAFMVKGLSSAASDVGTLFCLDSAGPIVEASVQLYNNAGTLQVRGGDAVGGTMRAMNIQQSKWYWWMMKCVIDSGPNDGTIDFYVDGIQVGAQVATIDQAVITQARWGFHTITGFASGHIFLDQLMADEATLLTMYKRYSPSPVPTKSRHIFVGPGTISGVAMLSTTAGEYCYLYDTDTAQTDPGLLRSQVSVSGRTSMGGPISFERGCYAVLGGTAPQAQIYIDQGETLYRALPFTTAYSDAGVKNYGYARR